MTQPITETALETSPTGDTGEQNPVPNNDIDPAVTDTNVSVEPAVPSAEELETTDDADIGKARKDAAKYRTRLRETEAERDQLRDQLAAQRRAIVDWRAANRNSGSVDPALLDAAGINIDELLDVENGHLDMSAVDTFISATVERFNLAKGFTPNRGQGQSGGAQAGPASLADAFRPR